MTRQQIKEAFHKAYNGQTNIMTPTIRDYRKNGNLIFEISEGVGMDNEPIYGVSILTVKGEKTRLGKGGFLSLLEAERYVKEIGSCQEIYG